MHFCSSEPILLRSVIGSFSLCLWGTRNSIYSNDNFELAFHVVQSLAIASFEKHRVNICYVPVRRSVRMTTISWQSIGKWGGKGWFTSPLETDGVSIMPGKEAKSQLPMLGWAANTPCASKYGISCKHTRFARAQQMVYPTMHSNGKYAEPFQLQFQVTHYIKSLFHWYIFRERPLHSTRQDKNTTMFYTCANSWLNFYSTTNKQKTYFYITDHPAYWLAVFYRTMSICVHCHFSGVRISSDCKVNEAVPIQESGPLLEMWKASVISLAVRSR